MKRSSSVHTEPTSIPRRKAKVVLQCRHKRWTGEQIFKLVSVEFKNYVWLLPHALVAVGDYLDGPMSRVLSSDTNYEVTFIA